MENYCDLSPQNKSARISYPHYLGQQFQNQALSVNEAAFSLKDTIFFSFYYLASVIRKYEYYYQFRCHYPRISHAGQKIDCVI